MFVNELKRTFSRPRNWVILGFLAVIPIVLGIVIKVQGSGPRGGGGPPFFNQVTQNPVFLALVALSTLEVVILPLCLSFVAGDTVAGEASVGSLRYVLTAPAGRIKFILTKLAVACIFSVTAALVISTFGELTGLVLFHAGRIYSLSGQSVSQFTGVLYLLEAAIVVGISMFSVVAVGLMISTMTDSPSVATAVTVGATVVMEVLDNLSQLNFLHPILLSHYWSSFIGIFRSPQVLHDLGRNMIEQVGWVAVTGLVAIVYFRRKDILS